jgi:dipeptidyl aminopeptidase/acylaminoacyl peptidase
VAYPELKGKPLGVTRWIGFKARDGLEMGAYLTVPPGAASKSRLPVIVLPHDDVEGRDSEDFNYLVHYLAARGYAVLRPQYRGSTIFGAAFKDAGNGEWARKIPTDLLDALTAAGATGQVDPARACIVGFGFGGYEALVGAAFHPGSYRCAASIGGISSLGLLVADYRRRTAGDTAVMDAFRAELGDTDRASLDAASPSRNAAAVSIPVLLVHGNHDAVVPIEQATLMAEALKAAGRPYELVVLDGENHTLHRSDMRIRTLSKLGEFLTKNLPTQP